MSPKLKRKNPIRNLFLLFAACYLSLNSFGCGYTTRSMISNQYRTIYITPFTNQIEFISQSDTGDKYKVYRPHLETDVTKAVIDRYMFDGNLKVVEKDKADLILVGDIQEFRRDPLRYDDNDNVVEYRLNMIVNISLLDVKENRKIWEESGYTGDFSYFVTGPQASSEDKAIADSIQDLARRIVERTVEQW